MSQACVKLNLHRVLADVSGKGPFSSMVHGEHISLHKYPLSLINILKDFMVRTSAITNLRKYILQGITSKHHGKGDTWYSVYSTSSSPFRGPQDSNSHLVSYGVFSIRLSSLGKHLILNELPYLKGASLSSVNDLHMRAGPDQVSFLLEVQILCMLGKYHLEHPIQSCYTYMVSQEYLTMSTYLS